MTKNVEVQVKTGENSFDTLYPKTKASLTAIETETAASIGIPADSSTDTALNTLATNLKKKIDTTTANASYAPSGFGLGTQDIREISSPDEALANGWYFVRAGLPGQLVGSCYILNNRSASNNATRQFAFPCPVSYQMCVLTRLGDGYPTKWGQWEWINPRIEAGVEYRTFERYRGNPVYIKDQERYIKDSYGNKTMIAPPGAAPAGFGGFGERMPVIECKNAEETYEVFCAKIDAVLKGMSNERAMLVYGYPPPLYGWSLVPCLLEKGSDQFASFTSIGTKNPGGPKGPGNFRIIKFKGVWQPLEWVEPPMLSDIEYRTTERYLGKPVYAKRMGLGTIVNGAAVDWPPEMKPESIVRYQGYRNGIPVPFIYDDSLTGAYTCYISRISEQGVMFYAGSSAVGGFGSVLVYYTKVGDN